MVYDIRKQIRKFASRLYNGYERARYVDEACSIRIYNATTDSEKNFIQIATRMRLNFAQNFDNTILGQQLGKQVAIAQFNYFMSKVYIIINTFKHINT